MPTKNDVVPASDTAPEETQYNTTDQAVQNNQYGTTDRAARIHQTRNEDGSVQNSQYGPGVNAVQDSQYHPAATRALVQLKAGLEKLLAQTNAAITADPPPYVPVPVANPQNVTVIKDSAAVYDTPHENAKVLGQISQGAVVTVTLDPSHDEHYTWYRIGNGNYKDHFLKGTAVNLQHA